MNASLIYLVAVADSLKCVGCMLAILLGIGIAIAFAVAMSMEDGWKLVRKLCIAFALSSCVGVFVPSAKTLAAMYVLPRIVDNAKITAFGDEALDLAIKWMRSMKPGEDTKEE